ncbi:hypothetical protein F-S17_0439 [Faustovirus]|nr:hypothetical protein F-LCD7_0443 [Faustovirus]QJX72705.1 hypothetical protein F-S17_0439 [Faustovirus]QJX73202.1 hypothetical protein F-VV57_0441 [Faustovirus]QJX73709.1 hypothetical protein F-VV63_0443 [Faustovirus]SMH63219.1 Hypothetical protein FSTVLC9_13 [Faustovirus]
MRSNYYDGQGNSELQYNRRPNPRYAGRCTRIDTHELLNREIYSQTGIDVAQPSPGSGSGLSAEYNTTPAASTNDWGVQDFYFNFDSRRRNAAASNYSSGVLSFDLARLNQNLPINNIVKIEIGSFWFPQVQPYDSATEPDFFYFRRVFARINELTVRQGYQAEGSNAYHFEFEIDASNPTAVLLRPIKPIYYAPQPINYLNTLTLNFYVPLDFRPVPIPQDTVPVVGVAGTNPAQFRILDGTPNTVFEPFPTVAPIATAVFVFGFNSTDVTINNNVFNNNNGIFVTALIGTDTVVVGALDFTALGVDTEASMYIAKNRIAFGMKFSSLVTQSTNHLDPVQI